MKNAVNNWFRAVLSLQARRAVALLTAFFFCASMIVVVPHGTHAHAAEADTAPASTDGAEDGADEDLQEDGVDGGIQTYAACGTCGGPLSSDGAGSTWCPTCNPPATHTCNSSGTPYTKPATCTASGYTLYYCSGCGKQTGSINLPATGHSYSTATCTTAATCSNCGATSGSASGHSYSTATCTTPATCSNCGATNGSASGHSYSAATCTTAATCSKCGATSGSPSGHSFSSATCTTAATCSNCGTTSGSPTGHSFSVATCTSGSACVNCGAFGGNALGHDIRSSSSGCAYSVWCTRCTYGYSGADHSYGDYSAWEYHSTTQHSRYQTCSNCGNVSTQTESHSATDVYTDLGATEHQHDSVCSTCTTNGATTILSTANEAHNFVYGAWTQVDTAQHYRIVTCSNCDHSHNEHADHADVSSDNYCDDCAWLMYWAEAIYTQPVAAAVMDGQTAVFSVVAGGGKGTAAPTYQWYIASDSSLGDAAPIGGATDTTYSIQGGKADDGKYIYVTIYNGTHTTTSDAVELTVYHTPEIYSHPTDAVVKEGEGISLQVTCYEGHGTAAPSYQWYAASDSSLSDATPVTGASSATYAFTGTRDANDRYFYCVISNGSYTVQTSAAHVTVYWAPDIDVQPVTQQIHENSVGQFDVAASGGNGTQEISYQWYMASDASLSAAAPISGAAAASYTHTASFADDGNYFYCVISNGIYTVQSTAVQLITEYPVTFKNYDSSTITTDYYAIGATITAPTEFDAPQSTNPLIWEYVFGGWTPAFNSVCDGRATYHATFNFEYIEYTVTFKDYDGTVISSLSYYYNDEIAVPPDPTRAADQIAVYQFAGWDKEVSPNCVGDAVYTAAYESTYREYTVTFRDHDGTELASAVYHWGDPVVAPADPARESTNTAVYTFDGWDSEVVACAGDATYTATYQESVRLYTVRFVDHDGSVISERTDYQYEDAVVPPSDPARAEDHIGTYSFSGWSPAVVPVAGDAVYTAQYETTYKEYTVVFQDHDGTELATAVYHWGDPVVVPDDPTRAEDHIGTHAFSGWSPAVVSVAGNAVYTAQYETVYKEYTVIFRDHDSTVISSAVYHWDDPITVPADPARESTSTTVYTFDGWDQVVSFTCAGSATYTATYLEAVRLYMVRFVDHDGSVISEKTDYQYEDTVESPPDPIRAEDHIGTHTFIGWDAVVTPVSSDIVYVAQYETIYKEYTVTFLDHDGTELASAIYHWGDPITVPTDPARESTNTTVYTFDGWGQAVSSTCAGDATYTATYQESVRLYTVRFLDHDSAVISERTDYQYEDAVLPPSDPIRAEDHIGTHTFIGWDPVVAPISGDATYTAQYETVYKEYTVTFLNHDGSELATAVYHWGDPISTPDDPTRDDYIFMGWGSEFTGECNGSVVYTAEYAEAYIVTFLGHDGSLISSTPYYYGATVNVPTAPERGYDGTYVYAFSGWSPAVSPICEGDATYTAVYTAAPVNVVAPGSDSGSSSPDEDSTGISFPDVSPDAWYADAIIDAVEKGLMVGMPDGSFAPLADSTRAQAVTTIYRMDGAPAATYLGAYSDVAADAWFTDAVEWGDIKDIVYGYGDGTFGPHDAITREQLVTLLWRYAQYRGYDVSLGGDSGILAYSDAHKISSWAYAAMEWACDAGLIQGTSSDILDPKGHATRAQLAVVLMRFFENIARN